MDTKLLFVCLGNICRSPAAEGVMQKMVDEQGLGQKYTLDSAGTYGGHAGQPADSRMRMAAKCRGYDLTSISRQVKSIDFERFDMIIAMDDSNYDKLYRLAPSVEAGAKIHRMAEFISDPGVDHIPDPYYGGENGFYHVLDLLEQGCAELLNRLEHQK